MNTDLMAFCYILVTAHLLTGRSLVSQGLWTCDPICQTLHPKCPVRVDAWGHAPENVSAHAFDGGEL